MFIAGKQTVGEYTIKEPGGNVRTVKYFVDPHGGFFADVHNSNGNDHSGGTYGGHHEHNYWFTDSTNSDMNLSYRANPARLLWLLFTYKRH